MIMFLFLTIVSANTGEENITITTNTNTTTTPSAGISIRNDILYSVDFREALLRLYQHELTKFFEPTEYKPFEFLTREQASKMIGEYAKKFFGEHLKKNNTGCEFTDINKADSTLKNFIIEACTNNLFMGSNGKFDPQATLMRAQVIAVMVRMIEGAKSNESGTPWRGTYYEKAKELGILANYSLKSMEEPITRYELAFLLHKFKIRNDITVNMNKISLSNEAIITIQDTITQAEGQKKAQVIINHNTFFNNNAEYIFINIFDTTYKVLRKNTEKYIDNSFVRYGELYDIEDNKLIGSISFTIINNMVFEGYIRPYLLSKNFFYISTLPTSPALYQIREQEMK